jgi:aryl-alcohol dehydrogenase-like predicted oxidoreductase
MGFHRPLGKTGIVVPAIGLGTVKIGRDQQVKYPVPFEIPGDEEVVDLLTAAKSLGVNLIDTAPAYGISETRIGALLPGVREEWILSTKVGEEFVDGQSHFDFSAAHTRMSIERSLQRLRTTYLDIVLIHSDGRDVELLQDGGVLGELQQCRDEGLIRAIGISSKTLDGGLCAIELGCDAVMVMHNPWYTNEFAVLARAAEAGVGVLLKKAFGSGHFGAASGSPDEAIRFNLSERAVSSMIVGTLNTRHLQENVATAKSCTA